MPRQIRKPKLWFVLELMHDERTDPSMHHSTEGLVHRLNSEQTKTFVFRFVFVLAYEQIENITQEFGLD